jgi:murein DD-endopeptidase MepM/ murein hydrolase activator NlpD
VIVSWGVTILAVVVLVLVLLRVNPFKTKAGQSDVSSVGNVQDIPLPAFQSANPLYSLVRLPNLNTTIPDGTRQFPIKYTVEEGDSIFAIAKKFALKPESILWANYDLLNDDPTYLAVGWKLTIPPTDGIYYKLKQDDTLQKIAEKYQAKVADIVSWPSNMMDVSDPKLGSLDYVMIPGGYRELQPWIVPLAFAPRSGATRVVSGPGGCQAPATGPVGSTAFIWPVGNHFLSGFDFSSYHLGIDIAAATGTPVYASDAGTVIYAGWNDSGYGYMVEIDHNNGYSTVYAHFSAVSVYCGQSVYQGSVIGSAGSTGKSTGAHVHFEIRLNGGFLNPWSVLP